MVKLVKTHIKSTYGKSYDILVNGITAGRIQSHWTIWLAFNNKGERIKPPGLNGYNLRRLAVKAVADYYDENSL